MPINLGVLPPYMALGPMGGKRGKAYTNCKRSKSGLMDLWCDVIRFSSKKAHHVIQRHHIPALLPDPTRERLSTVRIQQDQKNVNVKMPQCALCRCETFISTSIDNDTPHMAGPIIGSVPCRVPWHGTLS